LCKAHNADKSLVPLAARSNQRIKRCVAEYPKRHNYYEKHPDESGVKLVALDGSIAENRGRVTHKCIKKNRQQQHHERIELKGANQITVQQAVESAGSATARAIEASQQAKGTIWKKPVSTGLKNKKVRGAHGHRQPNQSDGQTAIYYPIEVHETAKLTRYVEKEKTGRSNRCNANC
jgi:hypothetical protein